jgi:hypothetical protein
MNAETLTVEQEQQHISLSEVGRQIRKDSDSQEPILREIELNAMLRLCDLMSRTGMIRIPAIVAGAVMAERDRIAILADQAK